MSAGQRATAEWEFSTVKRKSVAQRENSTLLEKMRQRLDSSVVRVLKQLRSLRVEIRVAETEIF